MSDLSKHRHRHSHTRFLYFIHSAFVSFAVAFASHLATIVSVDFVFNLNFHVLFFSVAVVVVALCVSSSFLFYNLIMALDANRFQGGVRLMSHREN